MATLENPITFYPSPNDVTREVVYLLCQNLYNAAKNTVDVGRMWSNHRNDFELMADYAKGSQGVERYAKALETSSSTNEVFNIVSKTPSAVVNWAARPIAAVHSKLMAVSMVPVIKPVDKIFDKEKKDFENRVRAYRALQSVLGAEESILEQLGLTRDQIPSDEIEFELFLSQHPKLKFESLVINEIQEQLERCNYDGVRSLMNMAQIIWGVSSCYSFCDSDGNYHLRWVPICDTIVGFSQYEDYNDQDQVGFLRYISFFELAKESGFDAEKLKDIAKSNSIDIDDQLWNNYSINRGFLIPRGNSAVNATMQKKIVVMDGLFLLTHNEKYTVKDAKDGSEGKRYIKEKPNYTPTENKQAPVVNEYYQQWYRGTWVVGSEECCVYNVGPLKNSIVKPYNPYRPNRPFHIYQSNKILGESRSMVENMVPYIDQCQIAYMHIQKLESLYVPPGYQYPLTMLQDVDYTDGQYYSPAQLVAALKSTGSILLNNRFDPQENPNPNATLLPTQRPAFLQELQSWFNILIQNIEMLYKVAGVSDVLLGNNPNPEVGKAQTEIALSSAQDILYPLYKAQNEIHAEICQDITINWQYKMLKSKDEQLRRIATRQIVCKIENAPTKQEWDAIYATANIALNTGELTASDLIELFSINNMAEARIYVMVKSKQNLARMAMEKQANIEMQTQGNMQAGVAVEQEKGKNMMMELQLKTELENVKTQGAIAILMKEYELKANLAASNTQVGMVKDQVLQENASRLSREDQIAQQEMQQMQQMQMQQEMPEQEDEQVDLTMIEDK